MNLLEAINTRRAVRDHETNPVAPIIVGYPKQEMGRMDKKEPEILYWD